MCQWNVDFINRTGQSLAARINQHVTANICKRNVDNLHRCVNILGSATAKHLLKSQQCAWFCILHMFLVLSRVNPDYHLKVLESM